MRITMKYLHYIIITTILFGISKNTFAAIYSFEDGIVPSDFSGNLQVSSERYKLGTKSLQWNWTANSTCTITNPSNLFSSSQNSNGGVTFWIYNPVAINQQLNVIFRNASGIQKCNLPVKLNFKGWRCVWARFYGDMGHDSTELTQMVLGAPDSGSGQLYIDYLEFSTDVSWERMSDFQYSVQPNNLDNFLSAKNANPTLFPVAPDATRLAALQTIADRLETWFFSTGEYVSNTYVKQRTTAFNNYVKRGRDKIPLLDLTTETDGTVTGPGLFQQFNGTKIDGTEITRFRDINEQYLIQLAYDYRKNNNTASLDAALQIFDWMNNQGWADGSATGTLRFEKLRSAGYFYGFFLLRNNLGNDRLNRELNTLNWFSLIGTCFQNNIEVNTDDVRTLHIARLIYALSLTNDNAKFAYIQAFVESLNNAYSEAHGYLDVFKPDGSGYHHRGVYYSSYYPQALYSACLVYYLLHDTPFALSEEIYNRLKQSLLTFRFISAGYNVPVSTSGRFPEGNTALDGLLPAFAYLILSKENPDVELTAAFKRLWKPDVDPLKRMINRASTDITFQSTIGEVEAMVRVAALSGTAEEPQTGALFQPFAGLLAVKRPQWALSVKGMSKYIWDYEATNSENPYGRYLSNGHIEWTNLNTKQKSFNSSVNGWNWSRLPGTTTKNLSAGELDVANSGKYRNFSADAFLGGVTMDDNIAFFSMRLSDQTFDNTFRARKSVFVIGNTILCLGSNIYNEDTRHYTETTLFQNAFSPGIESVKVNGNIVTQNQTELSKPVITDNYGNVYQIFSTGKVNIEFSNSLVTAYINHGLAPANTVYQYGMLPLGEDDTILKGIEIKRRDANAHYIYEPQSKTTALAIFKAGDNLDYGLVKRVNSPSLVLLKEHDFIDIVFSDPDMWQATANNSDSLSDEAVSTPGDSFNYEMELTGNYELVEGDDGVQVQSNGSTTVISAVVKEGKSYKVRLKNPSSSIQTVVTNDYFKCFPSENGYVVQSIGNEPFSYVLTDVSGRKIDEKKSIYQQHYIPMNGLPAGIFLISLFNKEQYVCQKIYYKGR